MSLKERNDAFSVSRRATDEESIVARDGQEDADAQPLEQEKTRTCLICRTPFPSAWAGERICRRCKSTSAWRSGALG